MTLNLQNMARVSQCCFSFYKLEMFCDGTWWSPNINHIVTRQPALDRAVPHPEGAREVQLEGAEVGQDGATPPDHVRAAATSQIPQEEIPKFLVLKISIVHKLNMAKGLCHMTRTLNISKVSLPIEDCYVGDT